MSKETWLKILNAQRQMMELKGTPGHAEQVKIVREMEMRQLGHQRSASYQNAG